MATSCRFLLSDWWNFPFASCVPRLAAICAYLLAFLVLCAASWSLWQWRFVPVFDSPALTLSYLPPAVVRDLEGSVVIGKGGKISITAGAEVSQMSYRWTRAPASRHALISFKVGCRGVKVGKLGWQDARIVLLWVDAQGETVADHLPLWSGRGTLPFHEKQMIVSFARGGTLPKLVIQNLGSEGEFTVDAFEVQSVVPRPGTVWATAAVVLAWTNWIAIGLCFWVVPTGVTKVRTVAAALLWTGFAWAYCLPGPWVFWPPLCTPYPIQAVSPPPPTAAPPVAAPQQTPATAPSHQPPVSAPPPAVTAKEPPTIQGQPERMDGALRRWVFSKLYFLKRPLHFLVFTGLSFLLVLLAGNWRAMWPAVALGAISEFCQWALGFGFDGSDVIDLLLDFIATLLGLFIWYRAAQLMRKAHPKTLQFRELRAADMKINN